MVDQSNRFENLNLRTSVDAPVRPGTTGTPPPELPKVDSGSAPEGPRHSTPERKFPWKRVIAVPTIVALGTAGFFGVKALTDGQGSPKPEPVATGPANPGTSTDSSETQNDSADRISPETLAKLAPEQLATFANIPAVKADGTPMPPQEHAVAQAKFIDALLNSGITAEEFKPFENTPQGQYEGAMQAKYDTPMLSSLFVDPTAESGTVETHRINLRLAADAETLGYDTYESKVELVGDIKIVEPQTSAEDDFTYTETLHFTDNAKQIGLVDFYKGSTTDLQPRDITLTYSVHVVNVGGILKSTLDLIK